MTPRSISWRRLLGVHHVEQRVVQRPQVGVDLLGERAGQEAERLARLDRGTGEDDAPDLLALERLDRHRHREVGLARACGTDAERHRVLADRVDVVLLSRGLGPDGLALVGEDDVAVKLGRAHVVVLHQLDRALETLGSEVLASLDEPDHLGEQARHGRAVVGRPVDGDLVASDGDVGLELVLDKSQEPVALPEQRCHVQIGRDDQADLRGFHGYVGTPRFSCTAARSSAEPSVAVLLADSITVTCGSSTLRTVHAAEMFMPRRGDTASPDGRRAGSHAASRRCRRPRRRRLRLRRAGGRPRARPSGSRRVPVAASAVPAAALADAAPRAPRRWRPACGRANACLQLARRARRSAAARVGARRGRHAAGHRRPPACPLARSSGTRGASRSPSRRQKSRSRPASASVSPGKPAITSVVTARPGSAARARPIASRVLARRCSGGPSPQARRPSRSGAARGGEGTPPASDASVPRSARSDRAVRCSTREGARCPVEATAATTSARSRPPSRVAAQVHAGEHDLAHALRPRATRRRPRWCRAEQASDRLAHRARCSSCRTHRNRPRP